MTKSQRDVSMAEFDRAFGSVCGVSGGDPQIATALREAGFSEELVERGIRLWESDRFLGFEDLATTLRGGIFAGGLGPDNRSIAPGVSESSIAEAAKRLDESLRDPGLQTIDEAAVDEQEDQLITEIAKLAESRFGYDAERARVYAQSEAAHSREVAGAARVVESLQRHRDALVKTPTMAERLARGKR